MAIGGGSPVTVQYRTSSKYAAGVYAKKYGLKVYKSGDKYNVYSTYQEQKIPETIADVAGRGGAAPTEPGMGGTAGAGQRDRNIILGGRQQRGDVSSRQVTGQLNQSITFDVPLPIQGINKAYGLEMPLDTMSGDMLNVIPKDILEKRIRLGQRPGLERAYSQQIGGNSNYAVVCLTQIVTVE